MKTFSIALRALLLILAVSVCAGGCAGVKLGSPSRVAVLTYNIYHGEDADQPVACWQQVEFTPKLLKAL
jgi:hypothetical protein